MFMDRLPIAPDNITFRKKGWVLLISSGLLVGIGLLLLRSFFNGPPIKNQHWSDKSWMDPHLPLTRACTPIHRALGTVPTPTSRRSDEATVRTAALLQPELLAVGLCLGSPVFIRIFKEERKLELFLHNGQHFNLFRSFPICAFSGSLGPKQKEGDLQAPEGFYEVAPSQLNPSSNYHLAFNLGYPNAYDRALQRTGSALMVHGNCVSIGCYAMTDSGIEVIYTLVNAALSAGQSAVPVHCFPFRLTESNLDRYKASSLLPFWKNLRDGYLFFEQHKMPPRVRVVKQAYVFSDR